jgi:hypothetical protein
MKIERTNHQDVAGPDQIATGTAGTGQGNEELEWLKRHEGTAPEREKRMTGLHNDTPGDHPVVRSTPKQVQRTTGLRGREIDQVKKPKRPVRSRTERDLLAYDSDVPYAAAEKASRNLVGSLIERQDRVTESLLLLINDLQYRIDDIECRVDDLKSGKRSPVTTGTGAGREVPE